MDKPLYILSTAFFGPVQYYTKVLTGRVQIEAHENYTKQSYRNRCVVLGANGPLTLSVPIHSETFRKIPVRDVRISWSEDWQRIHWRTLVSAYRSSPFFEFYCDELEAFFRDRPLFLFDLNMSVHQKITELLNVGNITGLTEDFHTVYSNARDFRNSIHPKKRMQIPDPWFRPYPYTQVFSDKTGFVPNLSILDLLFNAGPGSGQVLLNSIPMHEM
ncbi:MAG: WbqC family protein [Bacteroidetes bacterium]|nr:WbqC family protein [Bacteroidota bacterium]